jgi:probable rRNA maturation factor
MGGAVDVVIEDDSWKGVRGIRPLVVGAVEAALPLKHRAKVIVVLLANDATLRTLNQDWRGKKKPTNVLSFPASPDLKLPRGTPKPLGDIALSYETVAREAEASGKSLKAHTTHLIVHGVLHLLGYDHMSDAEAETMEAKEIRILKKLGIADPYQQS